MLAFLCIYYCHSKEVFSFFPNSTECWKSIMSRSSLLCLSLPNWTKWDQIYFVGEDVQQTTTTTRNRLEKLVYNRNISCLNPVIHPHELGNCATVQNAVDCNMLRPSLPSWSCDPQQNLDLQKMSICCLYKKKKE